MLWGCHPDFSTIDDDRQGFITFTHFHKSVLVESTTGSSIMASIETLYKPSSVRSSPSMTISSSTESAARMVVYTAGAGSQGPDFESHFSMLEI